MGLKVDCFAGFCYHHMTITSAHTHAYCSKVEQKQVCEQLLYTGKILN